MDTVPDPLPVLLYGAPISVVGDRFNNALSDTSKHPNDVEGAVIPASGEVQQVWRQARGRAPQLERETRDA
jgi:hypothetical protein